MPAVFLCSPIRHSRSVVLTPCTLYSNDDFAGAAAVFDEIWGWELDRDAPSERDNLAVLYVAGALASSNWVKVVRDEEGVKALLCADIRGKTDCAHDRALYTSVALGRRRAMEKSEAGRWILDFYGKIEAVNASLLKQMNDAGLGWDAELKLLITSPRARGKGYASTLVNSCLHDAAELGAKCCMLLTDTHCSWQYYEKTGWSLAARKPWSDGSGIVGFAFRKQPVFSS